MKKLFVAIILAFLCGASHLFAQSLSFDNLASHPRILLRKGDVTAMKVYASMSESARSVHQAVVESADAMLMTSPLKQDEFDGSAVAADELSRRIFYLSYAFVMTENMDYARRAEREMLAVATFESWNSPRSEDVAALTWALSLGYDWLYHSLPVHSRSIIGTAIYEKGLRAMAAKLNEELSDEDFLALTYGALATLERSPEFCKGIVERVVAHCNDNVLVAYSSDSAPFMGVSELADQITQDVMLVATLQSALGEGCGVNIPQEFMRGAEHLDFLVAPSGKSFNYGSMPDMTVAEPVKYWFAARNADASLVAVDERVIKAGELPEGEYMPLQVIFGSAVDFAKRAKRANSLTVKGQSPMYLSRSGWSSEADSYLAVKGGRAVDGHMDGGSFIYEWGGVRWAVDVGAAEEAMVAKVLADGKSRWELFRCGVDAHNTLKINGHRHNEAGIAKITESFTSAARKGAVVDMSELFSADARSVVRTVELDKKDCLKVSDHIIVGDRAATLEWKIATYATPEVVGPSMIKLSQNGQELYLRLISKGRSQVKIWPVQNYLPGEAVDEGLQRVGFVVEAKAGQEVDIVVEFSPSRNKMIGRLRDKFKFMNGASKR